MRRLSPFLAGLAAALGLLVLAQAVLRAQTGPLPLVSVFETHLLTVATVAALLALPGALGGGRSGRWVRLVILAVLVVSVVRLGGELWSPAPGSTAGPSTELTVLSWNLEMESKPPAQAVAGVVAIDADVVALQELTPAFGAAIAADGTLLARYPYRILDPRPGPDGLGLLAKRPLFVRGLDPGERVLRAGLMLADGRTLELFDVHPSRPLYALWGPVPVSLDTRGRDQDVARIAKLVAALDEPAAAVVIGDLNGTSSEAGLEALDAGLTDAHTAVGTGPGFTWRPDSIEGVVGGVLRIDHVLVGTWLTPLSTSVDCGAVGDHCRLLVTLRVAGPAAATR
jgi:endonuclease/exonuclease/phosphatase (EEP) superfamily protein YafD